jgi:hypothetical protein
MYNITDLPSKPEYLDHHFGVCPICHRSDGHVDVGRENWFVCHEHRVKWLVGMNLFSGWMYAPENELIAGAARIEGYREVGPIDPPRHEGGPMNDTRTI